jgi:triphosphoribosyl-dephospho-CoA synthase
MTTTMMTTTTTDSALIERVQIAHAAPMIHCRRLADLAVAALIDEVTLTPKPGLVDLRSRGAHRDLSWDLMCHSAWALHPTFLAMAQAGYQFGNSAAALSGNSADALLPLRETIGAIGRRGEQAMLDATGGVNTHRGAIWALGLLVTAAAQGQSQHPHAVAARAGALARVNDRFAPANTGNNGERVRREHGVGGALGQAQAGFPHALDIALPALLAARDGGSGEDAARLAALLAIIAELDDTCVLSRGGAAGLQAVQAGAASVLAVFIVSGAASASGKLALQRFEQDLLARNLSPGGAADLLAATLLLDSIAAEFAAEFSA